MTGVQHATRAHRWAITAIVVAQWFGTSLWFSPSGASEDLTRWLQLDSAGFGWLVSATQLGFILGTLLFVLVEIADRFPPERIFIVSSVAGAALNCAWTLTGPSYLLVWVARFGVGIALAGIYPMGMKMIVQRAHADSGWALGWLVAMLTLGTAMPQILRAAGASFPWQAVIWGSSALAVLGALLISLLPRTHDEARARVTGSPRRAAADDQAVRTHPAKALMAFRDFRASCAGYLGHMWELYAFWSVVPILALTLISERGPVAVATLSAIVIAAGSVGCVLGGLASRRLGSAKVAGIALAGSGVMCLIYPLLPASATVLKVSILALWGFFVIADSPQFAAITARSVPPRLVGTALTAQNSLGFLVTVVSIVALQTALAGWGEPALWLLLPGPLLGLVAMRPLLRSRPAVTAITPNM